MTEDLNMSSNQYSIALVVFFVTYVVFEAPSNMLLVRWKPSIYLPIIMTIWGALTCCMAAITDFNHLVVLRIFVGVFEAGFAPGILLIISSWYKKTEQSKRFAVYISAAVLSGAFGGLLAGAITGGLEGACGIRGWKWLFVSVLFGCIVRHALKKTDRRRCCYHRLGNLLILHLARLPSQHETSD
jgi:MFS family permease